MHSPRRRCPVPTSVPTTTATLSRQGDTRLSPVRRGNDRAARRVETPMPQTDVKTELDRQTDTLVALGYAALAGVTEDALRGRRRRARASRWPGTTSFVLVVHPAARTAVGTGAAAVARRPAGDAEPALRRRGQRSGDVVDVPDALVYAVTGVERGEEFCGVRPSEAAPVIEGRGRSMLTIAEGFGFLHAHPEALEKNKCFHAGATRGSDAPGARRSGSPTGRRTWAGAGGTTTTPGSASPPPRRGSRAERPRSLPAATNLGTCRSGAGRRSPRP